MTELRCEQRRERDDQDVQGQGAGPEANRRREEERERRDEQRVRAREAAFRAERGYDERDEADRERRELQVAPPGRRSDRGRSAGGEPHDQRGQRDRAADRSQRPPGPREPE